MPEDALDQLSKLSGIPRPEMQTLWDQVKENRRILDACVGPHDFSIEHERTGTLVRSYRCSRCGGHTDTIHRFWYQLGLTHGQRPTGERR